MIATALGDVLIDIAPWVCREHPCWWRGWTHRGAVSGCRPADVHAALRLDGTVVDALAAALLADRGSAGARRALSRIRAAGDEASADDLCAALWRRLQEPAPRLYELVDRVDGPVTALAVYLASLMVIDGARPAGYVWLEDLAEALMLPPLLIRQLRRDWEIGSSLPLAASA